jgi:DnaJ domain
MPDGRPSLLLNRDALLKDWLRRRLLREALAQLAEAAVFLAIGAVVIAVLSVLPILIVLLCFGWDLYSQNQTVGGNWPVAVAVYLCIGLLSTFGAWRSRHATASAGMGGRDDIQSVFSLGYEALFTGGSQCLTSLDCLQKCWRIWRLKRCDLDQVAAIVLWVFEQGRKARTREICAALPEVQVVRILPQLQDLPGIIWLTHSHQVIILSRAFRQELAALLGRAPKSEPVAEETYSNIGGSEEPAEPEILVNDEVLQWYRALDLPPFSSLEIVKRRYRQLVKIHHPDANPTRRPGQAFASDERIRQINAAYHGILSNSGR